MRTSSAQQGCSSNAQGAGVLTRLMRSCALLLVVPLMSVVGVSAPAHAADQVGVPAGNPPAQSAKLIVTKGGSRTANGVTALSGAQFHFFATSDSATLSGGADTTLTCTTDASGQCGVFVPLSGTGNNYFYAVEEAAPIGWTIAATWGDATDLVRYNSGAVNAGNTNRVRNLPETGRTWPDEKKNNEEPQRCGLDVAMIFDVSGSIDNTELAQFRTAGKGAVDALANTPSRIALSKFDTTASSVLPLTSVADVPGSTVVKNAISGIDGDGWTNWDRALWINANPDYDVVLMMTDGDPTTYGNGSDVGNTTLRTVEESIHSANAVKTAGAQVITLGIGMSGTASVHRLNQISSTTDTYTSSWEELATKLKEIATGVCAQKITVQKKVIDWQNNPVAPALSNGWQFTGSSAPGTVGAFPETDQVNGTDGFTSADISVSVGQTPLITLEETDKPGWTFTKATCMVDGKPAAVTPDANNSGKFTFIGKANATVSCEVTNKQAPPAPQLTLKKKVLKADGTSAPDTEGQAWTLTADGSGGFSGPGNTLAVTNQPVTAGTTYDLKESARAGYTNGTIWSCKQDTGIGDITFKAPNQVTLLSGQTATCTITNQVELKDLTVTKTAKPQFDRDYDWTIVKSLTRGSRFEVPEGTSASVGYQVVVTPSAAKDTNFKVTGTITVTNPNAIDIDNVTVTDSLPGATCALDGGPAPRDFKPGTAAIPYTCTLPNATPATTGINTAKLAWKTDKYHGMTGAANTTAPFDFATATVTTTDATAKVTDSEVDIDGVGPDGVIVKAVDGPRTFTYSRTIVGVPGRCKDYDNIATVKPSESAPSSSKATVTVCVGRDLDVDKIATLAYNRDYQWKVTKTGPGHIFVGPDGGTASYEVKLETNGYTDHDWKLGGTIFISNPNEWAMNAHIDDVTTLDGNALTCTIAGTADVTVPALANRKAYAYSCAGVVQGNYVGSNTATLTWDKTKYFSPHGTDDKTVAVDVSADASPQYASVSLSDVFDGGPATTVGNGPYLWTAVEGHPVTVTYTRPVTAPVDSCRTYINTVSVTGTPTPTSTATTEVCQPGIEKSVDASYGQRQTWSLTKEVDRTKIEVGPGDDAVFTYTVTATPGAVVDEGQARWDGIITISNPSATEKFSGTVSDTPSVNGWTCSLLGDPKVNIPAGGSVNVTYTCTGAGHASGSNTAAVAFGNHSVATTAPVVFDSTGTIDKTTTISDDIPNDGLPALEFPVDVAKPQNVFTYSRTLDSAAGICETYTNTAVLAATGSDPTDSQTVQVCREKPLVVAVDARGSFDRDYNWKIDKSVDQTVVEVDEKTGSAVFTYAVTVDSLAPSDSGYELTGTAKVSNPNTYADGDVTLTGGDISTDLGGGSACVPAAPIAGRTLAPGASTTVAFTCTFATPPALAGAVTVEVKWDPAGPAASAMASNSDAVALVIDRERYKRVDVIDDKTNPDNPVVLESGLMWQQGLHKVYTYQLTHQGTPGGCDDYTNTAVIDRRQGPVPEARQGEGDPSDTTTVKVCVERPPTVSATAGADLERGYAWSISKVADATTRTVDASGNATFRYTVQVTAGSETTSGWRMTGSATVSNPNAYDAGDITANVAATTDLGGGSVCTVIGGGGVLVKNGGAVTLPVSCTFTSAPAASGTMAVVATWDPAGPTATATSSGATGVTFGSRKDSDKTVAVVDDKTVPGQRIVLDPALTWQAGLVRTYSYDLSLPGGAAGACASYTNTASVDLAGGADPSSSATVAACTPAAEVLPAESFGKAVGKVKATCQGTVRAKLANRSGVKVTYKLRVGKKTYRINVQAQSKKKFSTKGPFKAKVTLKEGKRKLDQTRIPDRCAVPDVLPDTGLKPTAARMAVVKSRWSL